MKKSGNKPLIAKGQSLFSTIDLVFLNVVVFLE